MKRISLFLIVSVFVLLCGSMGCKSKGSSQNVPAEPSVQSTTGTVQGSGQ